MVDYLLAFSQSTGIFTFMNSPWGWPIAESVHFIGLSLLLGTVGVFDLRLLGLARSGQIVSAWFPHCFRLASACLPSALQARGMGWELGGGRKTGSGEGRCK